jgi:hypothetical protein
MRIIVSGQWSKRRAALLLPGSTGLPLIEEVSASGEVLPSTRTASMGGGRGWPRLVAAPEADGGLDGRQPQRRAPRPRLYDSSTCLVKSVYNSQRKKIPLS